MRLPGDVYLVGAGPGDPDLVTVRGRRLIESAEVLVYDSLASPELVAMAPEGARLIDVGKRGGMHKREQQDINEILVEEASAGRLVVRLKGGDPFMFGRGAEEAGRLREAGVSVHVVPGVTSPVAAPEMAGIPVTHRDHASSVTFLTGHESATKDREVIPWSTLVATGGTLVILMGMSNLRRNMGRLVDGGMDPSMEVAVIQNGTRCDQRTVVATVDTIADVCEREGIGSPAIVVVGSVARVRDKLGDLM